MSQEKDLFALRFYDKATKLPTSFRIAPYPVIFARFV